MNRLQELLSEVEAYLQKVSPRDRVLLGVTTALVVLFVVGLSGYGFSQAVHRHEVTIEAKTKSLKEIIQLAATYGERVRARQQLDQRLKAKVALFTFIDDVSKKKHIEIGGLQDRGSTTGQDKITESTVELDLNKVTLDKLTEFLNAIEHDPHLIKVKKMRLRARIDDPNSVDVSMTVAAYSTAAST